MKNTSTPIGKARIRQEGSDLTIITWGKQVFNVVNAAKQLESKGHSVEVIDLRSIRPLDHGSCLQFCCQTGRCLVVHEATCFAGVGAEIVSRVQQSCFEYLSAPILRVTNRDVPQPYATILEQEVMPNPSRIVESLLYKYFLISRIHFYSFHQKYKNIYLLYKPETESNKMAGIFLMPAASPTMEEGRLVGWKVQEGDKIEAGDILAEVETDKATAEIESYDPRVSNKDPSSSGRYGCC